MPETDWKFWFSAVPRYPPVCKQNCSVPAHGKKTPVNFCNVSVKCIVKVEKVNKPSFPTRKYNNPKKKKNSKQTKTPQFSPLKSEQNSL